MNGYFSFREFKSRSAIQPITTIVSGFGPSFTYSTASSSIFVLAPSFFERTAFNPLNQPKRPSIRSSADPRIVQVLIIAISAVCADSDFVQPREIKSCSTAADSAIFISHP